MKKRPIIIFFVLIGILAFSSVLAACNGEVSLNKTSLTLEVGATEQLVLSGASNASWSSNNETVASVSQDGTVSAHKKGTANITVTANEVSLTCEVTVNYTAFDNALSAAKSDIDNAVAEMLTDLGNWQEIIDLKADWLAELDTAETVTDVTSIKGSALEELNALYDEGFAAYEILIDEFEQVNDIIDDILLSEQPNPSDIIDLMSALTTAPNLFDRLYDIDINRFTFFIKDSLDNFGNLLRDYTPTFYDFIYSELHDDIKDFVTDSYGDLTIYYADEMGADFVIPVDNIAINYVVESILNDLIEASQRFGFENNYFDALKDYYETLHTGYDVILTVENIKQLYLDSSIEIAQLIAVNHLCERNVNAFMSDKIDFESLMEIYGYNSAEINTLVNRIASFYESGIRSATNITEFLNSFLYTTANHSTQINVWEDFAARVPEATNNTITFTVTYILNGATYMGEDTAVFELKYKFVGFDSENNIIAYMSIIFSAIGEIPLDDSAALGDFETTPPTLNNHTLHWSLTEGGEPAIINQDYSIPSMAIFLIDGEYFNADFGEDNLIELNENLQLTFYAVWTPVE